jgi:hypothetical protein
MDVNVILSYLAVTALCLLTQVACRHHQNEIRPRVAPLPRITTLRKQIRNFIPGSRASITIVYQTAVAVPQVTVRWFRGCKTGSLPYSELQDMLPVEGDSRYDNSSITAGTVIATTLIINKVPFNPYPAKFTLVLGVDSVPMQYQIELKIESDTPFHREYLDGMRWVSKPPPQISFGYHGEFAVECSTILDTESKYFLDELHLYRTYLERRRKHDRVGKIVSVSCGRVHRGSSNYLEDSGKYTSEGKRDVLKHGYVKYHVMLGVRNATREEQGMYTCALERKHDRTYVSSWVRQGSLHSKPYVEFLPCEGGKFNHEKEMLHFIKHQETCFRCRGYGYPLPEIKVLKDGEVLQSAKDLIVDQHVNVPDGGLSEITYVFLNPHFRHAGKYECIATNSKGHAFVNFHLGIINF